MCKLFFFSKIGSVTKTYLANRNQEFGSWYPVMLLGGVFVFTFAANLSIKSMPIDGFMWLDSTRHFYDFILSSDARNRPLIPFLTHLFLGPVLKVWPKLDHFETAVLAWRIGNWFFLVASVFFAFDGVRRATKRIWVAYSVALLIIPSSVFYVYMPHSGTQIHGFFAIYVALWQFAYLRDLTARDRLRLALPFGVLYGILMLGKPQFNAILSFWAFALYSWSVDRKSAVPWLHILMRYTVGHSIPIFLWATLLWTSPYGIQVYEWRNPHFSLVGYYIEEISKLGGIWHWLMGMPSRYLFALYECLLDGAGTWITLVTFLTAGSLITRREAHFRYILIYFWTTTVFLFAVRYLYSRHAGDIAILSYCGIGLTIDYIRRRIPHRWFLVLITVSAAIWTVYNISDMATLPIYDQCHQLTPPSICSENKT